MNYRKYYSEITGIDLKGFEIHHIDGDRTNNNLRNLVHLSIKEHRGYHKSFEKYNRLKECLYDPYQINYLAIEDFENIFEYTKLMQVRLNERITSTMYLYDYTCGVSPSSFTVKDLAILKRKYEKKIQ